MSKISFKKNNSGIEKVTDIINPIFIEHDYFGFTDDNYPFDSHQFRQLIEEKRISLLDIDKDSKFYSQLVGFIVKDKEHAKQLEAKEKAILKAKEDAEKAEKNRLKNLAKIEAKKKQEEKKAENKRNNRKVQIVTGEDISKSITDNI